MKTVKINEVNYFIPVENRPDLGCLYLRVREPLATDTYDIEDIDDILVHRDKDSEVVGLEIDLFPRRYESIISELSKDPSTLRFDIVEGDLKGVSLSEVLQWAYKRYVKETIREEALLG